MIWKITGRFGRSIQKAAKWIAPDALRELQGEKVERRSKGRPGRLKP